MQLFCSARHLEGSPTACVQNSDNRSGSSLSSRLRTVENHRHVAVFFFGNVRRNHKHHNSSHSGHTLLHPQYSDYPIHHYIDFGIQMTGCLALPPILAPDTLAPGVARRALWLNVCSSMTAAAEQHYRKRVRSRCRCLTIPKTAETGADARPSQSSCIRHDQRRSSMAGLAANCRVSAQICCRDSNTVGGPPAKPQMRIFISSISGSH